VNYSKIVNVKYEPSAYIVSVYPNPVRDNMNFRISAPESSLLLITVSDMQGKLIYSKGLKAESGITSHAISTQGWPSQLYLVNISGKDGKLIFSEKFLKD